MELIKKFLHYRGLPRDVKDRVTSFYDYQWRALKGADEGVFLMELRELCVDLYAFFFWYTISFITFYSLTKMLLTAP